MKKKKYPISPLTTFTIISGICSIAGVILLCFKNDVSSFVALALFSMFLLLILVEITVSVVNLQKIENGEDGYQENFVYISYIEQNNRDHLYDCYKAIQCKRPFLNSIWHKFDWTGTQQPKIDSSLQIKGKIKYGDKDSENPEEKFDKIELKFKSTLLYNQVTTTHFRAHLNDFDKKSTPCISYRIDGPISFILFKITLLNREQDFNKPAKLYKFAFTNNGVSNRRPIDTIEFNKETKTYTYPLINPQPGYTYYLYWDKND